jgi:hypothetical protein
VEHVRRRPAARDHDLRGAVAHQLLQLASGVLAQVALDLTAAHRVAERVMEERAGDDQGCTLIRASAAPSVNGSRTGASGSMPTTMGLDMPSP